MKTALVIFITPGMVLAYEAAITAQQILTHVQTVLQAGGVA